MLPNPPHCATSQPPGRSTAARFSKSASWSITQWKVAVDSTASTGSASGSGRPRSASTYVTWSPNLARRPRACSSIAAEKSSATTRPRGSRASSSSVTRPVPQPASSTVSSPCERQPLEHLRAPARLRVRDAVVPGSRSSRRPARLAGHCADYGITQPSGGTSTATSVVRQGGRVAPGASRSSGRSSPSSDRGDLRGAVKLTQACMNWPGRTQRPEARRRSPTPGQMTSQ